MWREPRSPTFLVVIAASILAHVAVLALLPPAAAAAPEPPPPAFVTIEAAPPPAPSPPPPPPTTPPIVAARQPVARSPRPTLHRTAPPRPTVATATPTPPPAAEPADFSGVTLTNDGAGWSTPIGDGSPMTAPIGAPSPTRAPVRAAGGHVAVASPPGDRVVAVGDLSRPPRAPDLDAQLAANYPRAARLAGTPGSAVLRVRILVDGRVGATRVVAESAPGFGVACQRTLAGSRWQPPLDARKTAVATDLSYTCTFAVAR
ncbi:MAG: energy transducer TonB [Proteobacteria bacterium]|nr:energy transducer TonB [Pseudomonadota bacterium]